MTTTIDIPPVLMMKIREFLADNKTGNVTLDIKHGKIVSWKIAEYERLYSGRVDTEGHILE